MYTESHPKAPSAHEQSLYLTYPERQCRCDSSAALTLHSPPGATAEPQTAEGDAPLPPCFLPTSPSQEPYLNARTNWDVQQEAGQRCFVSPVAEFLPGISSRSEMKSRVSSCLTPDRQGASPQRAAFLIGDSHASSIAPGLMVAFDGALSLKWTAIGGGCGVAADGQIVKFFTEGHERNKIALCEAYNEGVREALETQLASCDIVIVHQERKKIRDFKLLPYYTELQALVKRKSAKLVILGDALLLPRRGSYCVNSPASPHAAARCNINNMHNAGNGDVRQYFALAADESTHFIPIYQYFCDNSVDQRCNAQIPSTDTLAFFDEHHMTSAASLYLWPFLCADFEGAGLLGDAAAAELA